MFRFYEVYTPQKIGGENATQKLQNVVMIFLELENKLLIEYTHYFHLVSPLILQH